MRGWVHSYNLISEPKIAKMIEVTIHRGKFVQLGFFKLGKMLNLSER